MRRFAAIAAVAALGLLVAAGVATASHQNEEKGGSDRDFAVGGGRSGDDQGPFGETTVGFAAHGGPSGQADSDPITGHFTSNGEFLLETDGNATAFTLEGPVTCLVVDGNEARLFYPVKQSRPDQNEVTGVLISLKDNGDLKDGDPPDEVGFALVPEEAPGDSACVLPSPPATDELEKGNFTVHDAG